MGFIEIRPNAYTVFMRSLDFISRFETLSNDLEEAWETKTLKMDESIEERLRGILFFFNDGDMPLEARIEECAEIGDGVYTFTISITSSVDGWMTVGIDIFERTNVRIGLDIPITLIIKSQTNDSQHYTYTAEIDHYEVGDV